MRTSKFINLDPNVLLEWVYDSENFIQHDYTIVVNTLDNSRFLVSSDETSGQPGFTGNIQDNNLFLLDPNESQWAPIDPDQYSFLQLLQFPGQTPTRYDKIRLYFPVNYNFNDKLGFLIEIGMLDGTGSRKLDISQYFFDKTSTTRTLDLASPPLLIREKLWGKFIELQVPSPYALSQSQTFTGGVGSTQVPIQGSINANLAGPNQLGVNRTSPIFIDFRFINRKETILNQTTFYLDDPYSTTIPQVPEFETLGVSIQMASDGDYFQIAGTFNNSNSDFQTFMDQQASIGNQQFVVYIVTTIEQGTITDQIRFVEYEDFDDPVRFRPIINFSTTTAIIDVEMQVVNTVTDNFIQRRTSYSMLPAQVNKFGRRLTKINVANAFKPKIYNASPDNVTIQMPTSRTRIQAVNVPFPVLFDRYSIVTKNVSEEVDDETFYGIGELQILLYPSDNVVKLAVARNITNAGVEPFEFPTSTRLVLSFKSNSDTVEAELYYDSNQVDLENGILVFRITEEQIREIVEIRSNGFDQFYIESKPTNGVNSIIYAGRFLLFNQF